MVSDTARATLGGMQFRIEDSRIHRMSCNQFNANELKWLYDLSIDEGIRTAADLFFAPEEGIRNFALCFGDSGKDTAADLFLFRSNHSCLFSLALHVS